MNKRKNEDVTDNSERITKQIKILNENILSEDGTLKYDFMTSLQNIALAKIATAVWMNQNTHQMIVNSRQVFCNNKWLEIENSVLTQLSELQLPSFFDNVKNVVRSVGNSLYYWITYNNAYVLGANNYTKYSAIDLISNITWTSRGKVDSVKTAKNILANLNSFLSDDHKYKIACCYCLEDEIAVIAPTIVNPLYADSIKIDIHPMVYFWTKHLTSKELLCNPLHYDNRHHNNRSIHEYCLLRLLHSYNDHITKTFNEVPIRYMWNRLTKEEKSRNVLRLFEKLENQDLRLSLLSNLTYVQQQEVLGAFSLRMLDSMFNDWLWEDYFLPTALYVSNTMKPLSYFFILKRVNGEKHLHCKDEKTYAYEKYKSMFKKMWMAGSKEFKDFIFEYEDGSAFERFVTTLTWERDIDVIELIFNDLNTEQKKKIIFCDDGIDHCKNLIQNDQWDLLKLFVAYTLSSEEDISQLKQRLVKEKGFKIAVHFIKRNSTVKIENFMSWVFEAKEDFDRFKLSLAFVLKCKATLQSIVSNNKTDFSELENHFKWCTDNNLEVINELKNQVADTIHFEECMSDLIKRDKYELLDQILNWCFSNDAQKITHFKSTMYHRRKFSRCLKSLAGTLIERDESFKLVDKYVDWFMINEQIAQEFKMWLLQPELCVESICTYFLKRSKFEIVDKFINWCVTSSEEVNTFKYAFILSEDIGLILGPELASNFDLGLLVEWLKPSKEIAEKFELVHLREGFYYNYSNYFKFLNLVNEYIKCNESD